MIEKQERIKSDRRMIHLQLLQLFFNKSTSIYAYMCVYCIYINMSSIYYEYSLCRLFFRVYKLFRLSLFSLPFAFSYPFSLSHFAILFSSLSTSPSSPPLLFHFSSPLLYLHSYICVYFILFSFFSLYFFSYSFFFILFFYFYDDHIIIRALIICI